MAAQEGIGPGVSRAEAEAARGGFEPHVPAARTLPELTPRAVLTGIALGALALLTAYLQRLARGSG